jgi:hypothetical protein
MAFTCDCAGEKLIAPETGCQFTDTPVVAAELSLASICGFQTNLAPAATYNIA